MFGRGMGRVGKREIALGDPGEVKCGEGIGVVVIRFPLLCWSGEGGVGGGEGLIG